MSSEILREVQVIVTQKFHGVPLTNTDFQFYKSCRRVRGFRKVAGRDDF